MYIISITVGVQVFSWLQGVGPTFVSAHFVMMYFLSSFAKAILLSILANLSPMQYLGPAPNGRKEYGFIFGLFDGENL